MVGNPFDVTESGLSPSWNPVGPTNCRDTGEKVILGLSERKLAGKGNRSVRIS